MKTGYHSNTTELAEKKKKQPVHKQGSDAASGNWLAMCVLSETSA